MGKIKDFTCPGCGAPYNSSEKNCHFCGREWKIDTNIGMVQSPFERDATLKLLLPMPVEFSFPETPFQIQRFKIK